MIPVDKSRVWLSDEAHEAVLEFRQRLESARQLLLASGKPCNLLPDEDLWQTEMGELKITFSDFPSEGKSISMTIPFDHWGLDDEIH